MRHSLALLALAAAASAAAQTRAPELPDLAEFTRTAKRSPAPAAPAAKSAGAAAGKTVADDSTPLAALPAGGRIRFSTPVDLPPEFTHIIGDRGFYTWHDGALTPWSGGFQIKYDARLRGAYCWITLNTLGSGPGPTPYSVLPPKGPRPLNGYRELRFRRAPEPWLSKDNVIVVAGLLRDPQVAVAPGPFVEAVFCSKGGPASEFTVGDLREAFGRERTQVVIRSR